MHSPCESFEVSTTVCCDSGKQLYLRQHVDTSGVVYLFLFMYYEWQQCTEVFLSIKSIVAVNFCDIVTHSSWFCCDIVTHKTCLICVSCMRSVNYWN